MTDEQTTGTPGQEGGDAAQQPTAGTPATDGRDAGSQEPDYKALYLAAKDKVEEANRLREQLASMEAPAQSPAAQEPAEDESFLEGLRYAAQKGDPAAIASLKIMEQQANQQRDLVDYIQIQNLPPDERDEVSKHYLRNRNRLGDVKAARAEIREAKLAKRVEELERRNALLSKTPPDPTVSQAPPTNGREYTAPQTGKRELTEAQFDQELARIRREQGELAALQFRSKLGKEVSIKTD